MRRYLVLTRRTPDFDPGALAPHYAFLDGLRRANRLELAAPFSDRAGGAYLLCAGNLAAATAIAHSDPLHLTHSSEVTVHEWDAK